jgi:tRNA-Thr(GGU) m(6)t(6)A37 methyltransferase TsaA
LERSVKTVTEIRYRPIGIIHSPFEDTAGIPVQTRCARGIGGTVEIKPEYAPGLKDIEGFSHIILIYHFHLSESYSLKIQSHWDDKLHGLFTTRSPRRPNPIGLSVVRLIDVEGCRLQIEDLDIVDGTPLLDIKPYIPRFDVRDVERTGWISDKIG